MHSSRMRTVRSSGRISGGGVPGLGDTCSGGCTWSGGSYLVPGGVPGPVGVYLVWGGHLVWGVYLVWGGCTWSSWVPAWGCTCLGGVPGPGGCTLSRGYTWSGGVSGPREVPGQVLIPGGQTDACKNITFATLLRTVIIRGAVVILTKPLK